MILINIECINEAITKLQNLLDSGTETEQIWLSASTGHTAAKLQQISGDLVSLNQSVNQLITASISFLENARDSYVEADENASVPTESE